MRAPAAVSVVMPTYNAGSTLEAAIRAVLDQELSPDLATLKELIVVDDASDRPEEDPARAMAAVADPRVRLIRRATNGGPAAARATATAVATGDLLAFADADDLWLPGKLEAQCRVLHDRPDVGAVYGWVDVVDPEGRIAFSDQRARWEGDVYARLLEGNFIYSGSNLVVRREVFDAVGGFDVSLRAVEDWALHVQLARRTSFACVPDVLVHYRLGPDSLSARLDVMERAFRQARDGLFAEAPPELRPLERRCSAAFYVYLAMRASQRGLRPSAWLAGARYALLALWFRPAAWVEVLRGAAPLAPLRLSWRELIRGRRSGR